ncbi:unnamed protein product [Cylindrotheca closterium]|uniref:Uncharacterized protein n=1 Tax=Cylindrotheca closterium TaxID=2856 RepID=A0AAD2JK47_9STRA|nr:unnamed protein product [Cylindrotheca closterium]
MFGMENTDFHSGILISRSVRSHFACLTLIPCDIPDIAKTDKSEYTLIRLQFYNHIKELRAFFRRGYKLGDKIEIRNFRWENIGDNEQQTSWTKPRIVVDFNSIEDVNNHVTVRHSQYWNMQQCQAWKNHLYPKLNKNKVQKEQLEISETKAEGSCDDCRHHGSGLAKRFQASIVASFLIHATMFKLSHSEDKYWPGNIVPEPNEWKEVFGDEKHQGLKQKALNYLNSGAGVVDAAGGSGHVSMALGMEGIKSTVVDSRSAVGKLPGRDRKIWNKALKKKKVTTEVEVPGLNYCQVIPFDSHRAWFGSRPEGVDKSFRHPDEDDILLCDKDSELVKNASAIVALHPDEATGDVVEIAAEKRIPFAVVPCCVFCRLFPQRRKSNDQAVSSYEDLLEYLMNIDSSIRQSKLPF